MLTNKLLTAVRKTVLMVLLTASFAAAGDAQNVLWKNRFNGAGDNSDRYNQAVADGAGNYYLTGYTINPEPKRFSDREIKFIGRYSMDQKI